MTLAGFKSSNHPQQTAKRGAKDAVDDRGTDPAFIASLEDRFGRFTLDVAAAEHNAKAPQFFTREQDGLRQHWGKPRGWPRSEPWNVWCNPPYSDCSAWVGAAWAQWQIEPDYIKAGGRGLYGHTLSRKPDRIVMLLPANRVEQGWWQDWVEPHRDRPGSPLRVEFLRGRMRFERPDWTPGPKGDRPPFGCALLIWEDR